MNRAEAAAEAGVRLATVLADAGMVAADSPGNLKEPLDDAFRALGVAEGGLAAAESDDPVGLLALVRLFALRSARDRVADRFDVGIAGDSYRLNQTVATLERLIAEAERAVAVLFGPAVAVGGAAAGDPIVTLDLNFLEDGVTA